MKKFISVLILVAIMASFCTVSAFAEGTVHSVSTLDELNTAIGNAAAGDTIKLTADIGTPSSPVSSIITINKAITLDGAGNTLTTNGPDRAIEVACAGVTIKNLIVKSSGERGINFNIGGKLTLDSVNVTASHYAVNLPTGSVNADVTISNSTLTSFVPVNMHGQNSKVTVSGSTLNSDDKTPNDNDTASAIHVNGNATGASVTVTGSTLNITSANQPAIWVATKGVTVDASGHSVGRAQIRHGSGGTNATLEAAIVDYTPDETLYLLCDIDLGGKIIEVAKNIIIDMDGCKITNGALKLAEGVTVTVVNWPGTEAELEQFLSGKLPVPNRYNVPSTADNSNMPLWAVLFIGFAAVALLTGKKRRA